jgi:hypothetical protein
MRAPGPRKKKRAHLVRTSLNAKMLPGSSVMQREEKGWGRRWVVVGEAQRAQMRASAIASA